tara:strand:- start:515 stop:739 length:225 start_codon:yes stop_codon:yes gene_type:complete
MEPLPPELNRKTSGFFEVNLTWLKELFAKYGRKDGASRAAFIISALEGAIILSSVTRKNTHFENTRREIQKLMQ